MKKTDHVAKKTIETVKKVVSIAMTAVILLIAVLGIWILIDKFIIGSPVPRLFGYSALSVGSGSMRDALEVNDLVIIKKTEDYEVGDIVTYLREDENIPTTHRIVGIAPDGKFITKGDANNTNDRFPVGEEEILGEVVKIKVGAGATFIWVKSQGWIYLLGFAVLLTAASFFLDTGKDETDKTDNEEKEEIK